MKFLLTTLFAFCLLTAYTQTDINKCGHDEWLEAAEQEQPGYIQKIKESFETFKKIKKSDERINITIPVHIILVHPTGQPIGTGSNHSLAHVQSQIDVLNQDFGRYNSDAGNTPPDFPAADTGIQFCLATVDPDGNPTDGITRYPFDGAFHPNSSTIREETRWPRDTYSNIWSAPNLPYLGLASVPSTFSLPSPNNDFIHVDAATFGGPGFATFPNYNLGRTTTHEMGHYLGLFHVWGNGGCGNDDGISDTPVQDDSNFGCPNHPSPSCGNGGDMFMNYMDYVNDNCMNAFTQEQGEYMNTILTTSRASLNGASFTACASSVPLVLSVTSQTDPSCTDSNDGVILVEASGGVPDYSYSLEGGVPSPNNLFTDLPGGNYSIEVFDNDGNSASVMVFLNTPLPITATANILATNDCPNDMVGSIEIQVSGGSNPYMYTLNNGMSQASNTFDSLSNGFYVYQVEDNNGCTFEGVFELEGLNAIEITIDSTANLICGNDNMGLIIASAEGGTGPLSYSLNGFDFQGTGEFLELDGGSYFVYVQDSVGCYDSLAVTITEPDPFFISLQSNDVTCFGYNDGNVVVTANGGNGAPYQYSFDSISFGDATMLDSLFAGEYDLYALDSLGCLAIATFAIEEPDEVLVQIDTIVNVDCFGDNNGMVSISATGGNGNYTYIFQGDSTATGDFNTLEAGTYDIDVVDSNGCEGSGSFEVGINSTITLTGANIMMPSCFGDSNGSIEVSATNTQGTVVYSINGGTEQASPIFTGLSANEYLIVVQDDSGCNAAITVDLDEPTELMMQIVVNNNVTCSGGDDGNATILVTGGTGPYEYSNGQMGMNPANLAAGTYSITVTDANGCIIVDEFDITEPDALSIIILSQTDAECETQTGGTLILDAMGGTGAYTHTLEGPSGTFTNITGSFQDLNYGSYIATVTDENGCIYSMDIEIALENNFYADLISVTGIRCWGENGGSLEINVKGGLGDITFYLDGAEEVDPANLNTHSGDHSITIVDENDCMIELFFVIEEPEELVVDQMVFDNSAGTVTVFASGGVEPYMYSFNGGPFTDSNETDDISSTEVMVVVRDANGCEVEAITFIEGVNDLALDWGINAYPNPFQEQFTLELDFPNQIEATIEIFDISGRLTHNISTKKYNSGKNIVKIDLRNFASSIYIVKIASAEGYRFIKATKM